MKWLRTLMFRKPLGNSIDDVKSRLIFVFSVIALTSSSLVFFSFSLHLILNENTQIERHLMSFESIAQDHFTLVKDDFSLLGPYVRAYYSEAALDKELKSLLPYEEGIVTRFRTFSEDGFMVYYAPFVEPSGIRVPLYLVVGTRGMDFGDDSWGILMLISFGLMAFLIAFLRFSLRRVFDGLMSPVLELSQQLTANKEEDFHVSERSIDEIKALKHHLNMYKQMKERLAKQEMMFAKYASHELKTPIAVVLGAANLQAMKDEPDFQSKQRKRILIAANNMHATVEVLLSIVKQENVRDAHQLRPISSQDISLDKYYKKLNTGVQLLLSVELDTQINMSPAVLDMVLKNLLNNAIRFTEKGKIEVVITSNNIKVIDSGCGLNEEVDTEHGLGLLIVKRLCDSYGWTFSLTENPSEGCCAELNLST
ncbi:sensor histidine kinase [Photobacterium profundum]|uniref:histidine kinase n=1 Tax=Photobacterium profundum 3TCK TaxID=314280 RepID=Q1Z6K1_9GAMM|nr:HAMP domain-containing sensor histidine kinase [Photobacterium profundum]EAS44146.1 putative two-component sensor [Photobacterium profundum 3TCK]